MSLLSRLFKKQQTGSPMGNLLRQAEFVLMNKLTGGVLTTDDLGITGKEKRENVIESWKSALKG